LSRLLLLLFWGVSLTTFCQEVLPPVTPQKLVFSYVNHPVIVERILPMLEKAYGRLGIEVAFVMQPSARNLKLVAQGVTDGEAVYSDLLINSYPNLLIVEPPFFTSIFVLLCHKSVVCQQQKLSDASKTLVLTDASREGLQIKYEQDLKMQLYSINSLDRIPQLIESGKMTYGIYVTTEDDKSLDDFHNLQATSLFTTNTYHILNEKHQGLIPSVSASIMAVLAEK
jgi:hypothetical protein